MATWQAARLVYFAARLGDEWRLAGMFWRDADRTGARPFNDRLMKVAVSADEQRAHSHGHPWAMCHSAESS